MREGCGINPIPRLPRLARESHSVTDLDPTFLLGSKEGDKDVPSASLCGNCCDLGFDTELAACGVGPGEI